MPTLPPVAILLAAAANEHWRAVLGLRLGETITAKEARRTRASVHPDKGGSHVVAAAVGRALDEVGVQEAPIPRDADGDPWLEELFQQTMREIDEREERRMQELKRQRREEWERRQWERMDREELERRRRATREAQRRSEEERRQRDNRTAAQRLRRQARRPGADVAAQAQSFLEPCEVQEATPVAQVRSVLQGQGFGQSALVIAGLTKARRRQRGAGKDRVYFFVDAEQRPLRLIPEPASSC